MVAAVIRLKHCISYQDVNSKEKEETCWKGSLVFLLNFLKEVQAVFFYFNKVLYMRCEKNEMTWKVPVVFLMNFKKEVEGFFSCKQSVKYEMPNGITRKRRTRRHKSGSSIFSSISWVNLREEQGFLDLETRTASRKGWNQKLQGWNWTLQKNILKNTEISISNA